MPETQLAGPAAAAAALPAGMAAGMTPSEPAGADGSSVEPVLNELCKTASEAQKLGEPYFFYYEESVAERNAMAVKKQPLQYVPKHLDWYCRICGQWVDDDQEVCTSVSLFS